jgi:hypothetical protein
MRNNKKYDFDAIKAANFLAAIEDGEKESSAKIIGVTPTDDEALDEIHASLRRTLLFSTYNLQRCLELMDGLDQRLAIAEAKTMEFRGVWQSSTLDYKRGDMTTCKGALWHANCPTRQRPGEGNDWQLAVKQGEAA